MLIVHTCKLPEKVLVVVQLLSHVWLFANPWTAALQASRYFIISQSQTHVYWVCDATQPPISSSVTLSSFCLQSFPASIRVFSNKSALRIRWPKYWSFSISPSNEYSGLISFRIDCFDLLAVQGTFGSPPAPQFKSINSLVLSFFLWSNSHIHRWQLDKP